MSYAGAITGLKERLATVTAIRKVLHGEPNTAHVSPFCWLEAGDGTRQNAPQVTTNIYHIRINVVVDTHDNVAAEDLIGALINSVPAAIDDDNRLGGRVVLATVTDWNADYIDIGEKRHRRVVFITRIKDQGAQGGSI